MNPRKILIFSLAYYPTFVGGAEVAVKEITDRLGLGLGADLKDSQSLYDFYMITLGDGTLGNTQEGTIKVFRVGNWIAKTLAVLGLRSKSARDLPRLSKILFPLLAIIEALRLTLIEKYKFNLVWSLMANQASASAWAFKLIFRVPFLLTLQEGDPIEVTMKKIKWVLPFYKLMFKSADKIQAISYYLKSFAVNVMHVKSPVIVMPNGFDPAIFFPPKSEAEKLSARQAILNETGWPESSFIMVTSSRLVPKNGIEYVLRAIPGLISNGVPVKFFIIGDGHLKENLKQIANELNINNSVYFKGYADHVTVSNYLRGSDVFIRPSLSEGLGNSFVEAFACGLPIIATPVGGIVDFLKDPVNTDLAELRKMYMGNEKDNLNQGHVASADDDSQKRNGVSCLPKDPDSIVTGAVFLYKNPKIYNIASAGAISTAKEYRWEVIVGKMKSIFDSILSRGRNEMVNNLQIK